MAIKMISSQWCGVRNAYKEDFLMDTDADVVDLPQCCVGSGAVAVNTGNVYIVNASGEWVAFGSEG